MFTHINHLTFFIIALISSVGISQIYNTEVEAKIDLEDNNEFVQITGSAFNSTDISQSLRYVLSVIRTNSENKNISKNDQEGRIVLNPGEKTNLSSTTINSDEKDRMIILLLIYDLDDNLIGKDRVVLNKDPVLDKENEKIIISKEEIYDSDPPDGVILRGIVVEDTKTKLGRDFYTLFYSSYSSNNINGDKIVKIKEVLTIANNTKIEVFVGDTKVFEFLVRPRYEYIKGMSNEAIKRVYQYFKRMKEEKNTIKRY